MGCVWNSKTRTLCPAIWAVIFTFHLLCIKAFPLLPSSFCVERFRKAGCHFILHYQKTFMKGFTNQDQFNI